MGFYMGIILWRTTVRVISDPFPLGFPEILTVGHIIMHASRVFGCLSTATDVGSRNGSAESGVA